MATTGLDNLEIVLVDFLGALGRGDHEAVRAVLAADVVWQGLREEWSCHGPDPVVDTLEAGFENSRPVDALEFVQAGDHVVMGVRGARLDAIDDEPLGGQIFNVFTLRDGRITRIQDYRQRSEALAAAGAADPGWR